LLKSPFTGQARKKYVQYGSNYKTFVYFNQIQLVMENMKLLIIDDDLDILMSLKVILEDKGFIVDTASNKNEGLRLCSSQKPDLIILDIMMEDDLEGYSILKEFKNNDSLRDVPIIMYSGMAEQIGVNFRSAIEDEKMFPNVSFIDKREDVQDLILEIKRLLNIQDDE